MRHFVQMIRSVQRDLVIGVLGSITAAAILKVLSEWPNLAPWLAYSVRFPVWGLTACGIIIASLIYRLARIITGPHKLFALNTHRMVRLVGDSKSISLTVEYGIDRGGPELTEFTNPTSLARGQRILLKYSVVNNSEIMIPVWLGANFYRDEEYFFNTDEDARAVIETGANTCYRQLTIMQKWQRGGYKLHAEVWFGKTSDPQQSVALATLWAHPHPINLM